MVPDLRLAVAILQRISSRDEVIASGLLEKRMVDKLFSADVNDPHFLDILSLRPSSIRKVFDYFNLRYADNALYFRVVHELGEEHQDQSEMEKYLGDYKVYRLLPTPQSTPTKIDESGLTVMRQGGIYKFEHRLTAAHVDKHCGPSFFLMNRIHFVGIGLGYIRTMAAHEVDNTEVDWLRGLLTTIADRDH